MNYLLSLWKHRTKILGYSATIFGTLAVADPALLVQLFGPKGVAWVTTIHGVLIALVGHHNTQQAKKDVPK